MALRIIDGVPGSGKTYYAVRHVYKSYFSLNKETKNHELSKPCTIITNIDSFQADHVSLQDEIKNAGGVVTFFEKSFQEAYKERYSSPIVYLIDEAQMLFRKGDRKLTSIFGYFEWHRHWGQDIYLVTQNARKLPLDLTDLVEYTIHASPRVRSIAGEFSYKWKSDGDVLKREAFRPDAKVFALYKSCDVSESEKIKNPIMKTVALSLITAAFIMGFAGYSLFGIFHPEQQQVGEFSADVDCLLGVEKDYNFFPVASSGDVVVWTNFDKVQP